MTPFMLRVSDVLDLPAEVELPDIQASRRLPAAIGADEHVECRSIAEQLVCEANVVLAANDYARIELTDEVKLGQLCFELAYGSAGRASSRASARTWPSATSTGSGRGTSATSS